MDRSEGEGRTAQRTGHQPLKGNPDKAQRKRACLGKAEQRRKTDVRRTGGRSGPEFARTREVARCVLVGADRRAKCRRCAAVALRKAACGPHCLHRPCCCGTLRGGPFCSCRKEPKTRSGGGFRIPPPENHPHRPNASPQAAQRSLPPNGESSLISLRLLSQRKRPFPLGEDEQRRGADVRRTGGRSGPKFVRTRLRPPLLEVTPRGKQNLRASASEYYAQGEVTRRTVQKSPSER